MLGRWGMSCTVESPPTMEHDQERVVLFLYLDHASATGLSSIPFMVFSLYWLLETDTS